MENPRILRLLSTRFPICGLIPAAAWGKRMFDPESRASCWKHTRTDERVSVRIRSLNVEWITALPSARCLSLLTRVFLRRSNPPKVSAGRRAFGLRPRPPRKSIRPRPLSGCELRPAQPPLTPQPLLPTTGAHREQMRGFCLACAAKSSPRETRKAHDVHARILQKACCPPRSRVPAHHNETTTRSQWSTNGGANNGMVCPGPREGRGAN